MAELPGFHQNMMEARKIRVKNTPEGTFTLPEMTVDSALSALNVASLDGLDKTEIQRRAVLIKGSGAYASASVKIDERLKEAGY